MAPAPPSTVRIAGGLLLVLRKRQKSQRQDGCCQEPARRGDGEVRRRARGCRRRRGIEDTVHQAVQPQDLVLAVQNEGKEKMDEPMICQRCRQESYCSEECKRKHWEGANKDSDVPNCHKAWCIPINFEMEAPTEPIGESNVGERAYEDVTRYLNLSMNIGNSGRRSEEKAMLEELLAVDPMQPAAYVNLFVSCSELAIMAERYRPERYKALSYGAIVYLTKAISLVLSDEVNEMNRALDNPNEQMEQGIVNAINVKALGFIDECMRGQRGEGNQKLENIQSCLMACMALFYKRNEPTKYKLNMSLGFCFQKLTKYEEAVDEFAQCCHLLKNQARPPDVAFWYHSSLAQLPQCLSCVALYRQDKDPAERVEVMEKAVSKFEEAIAVLKKEQHKGNSLPVYKCQSQLARCLYNKNSMRNQFAQRGAIGYGEHEKHELQSTMRRTAESALEGAVAAGDMAEVQTLESFRSLPFS